MGPRVNFKKQLLYSQMERGGMGGMDEEFGISRGKLLHPRWINNKVLLDSTGNYIQHSTINHNGKEYGKQYIHVCN